MTRYLEKRGSLENVESFNQIMKNASKEYVDAREKECRLREELALPNHDLNIESRLEEAKKITKSKHDIYLSAWSRKIQNLHTIWYPAYCLYAEDHKLLITEEDYLNVCNEHHRHQLSRTDHVIPCNCSDLKHTYSFKNCICDQGGQIYLDYGFITL